MAKREMSNIDKIKAEIERRAKFHDDAMKGCVGLNNIALTHSAGWKEDTELLAFIDSLPDENNPEPYNPVYDEDYLNKKIAKATKSWEGVDVNKMLADCRGYEEKPSDDLEEAADDMSLKAFPEKKSYSTVYERVVDYNAVDRKNYRDGIIAGAEWQKEQMMKEWLQDRDGCFWDGVNEGKKAMRDQMIEDAVEGEIGYWNQRGLSIRLDQSLEKLGYGEDTDVKIIILKK